MIDEQSKTVDGVPTVFGSLSRAQLFGVARLELQDVD
jgi:hypothetical protein